jgi:hypothetical protein
MKYAFTVIAALVAFIFLITFPEASEFQLRAMIILFVLSVLGAVVSYIGEPPNSQDIQMDLLHNPDIGRQINQEFQAGLYRIQHERLNRMHADTGQSFTPPNHS